jgi:hypothetical protein
MKRGFGTKKAALDGLREALSASSKGGYAKPSKMLTGDYLASWLDGLRLAPSTVASYPRTCASTSSRTSAACRWPA